jgi:aspartyl protease family protein
MMHNNRRRSSGLMIHEASVDTFLTAARAFRAEPALFRAQIEAGLDESEISLAIRMRWFLPKEHAMRNLVLISIALCAVAAAAPQMLDFGAQNWTSTARVERPIVVESNRNRARPDRDRTLSRTSDVKIPVQADGHFYVDGRVNGRNVALVVDTGASIVALRESDARRAGIRISRSDFNHPIYTANGTAYAAEVSLQRVSIGRISVRDVRAVVIPDDRLSISLLGASFLNELRRFQVANNILVLEN